MTADELVTTRSAAPSSEEGAAGGGSGAPDRSRGRRRGARRLRALLVALVALAVIIPGAGAIGVAHLESRLQRTPGVFDGLPDRPARATGPAADAVNILVLGTDRRSEVPTTGSDAEAPGWVVGEQRSDTMMLIHIDADREGASVVSVPRDAWVPIPGYGEMKVNAAYSLGGPRLATHTFEQLTGVHVDHLAVVDWSGFIALTDLVGGVTVDIPSTVHDSARDITWTQGRHRLDGDQALAYVRQRYGLPGGDLDRVRRQQVFLRQLMGEVLTEEVRTSPAALLDVLDVVTEHATVDDRWSLRDMAALAWSLRSLRVSEVTYLTAPVAGFGQVEGQSIVRLDEAAGKQLWHAVRWDEVSGWVEGHPDRPTPSVVD
ncbi:LCP family protein [Nocardioides insulae]|uniref:LCP family protein n=1 Tax=Nocardioides insulae TaxID=394734 RepID=UPI00041388C1|nr:LCP family protein [Nocardioides insulae]